MLLKDSSDLPLYSLIVDVPGKLKGVGFRRVYNKKIHVSWIQLFLDEKFEYVVCLLILRILILRDFVVMTQGIEILIISVK